MLIELAWEGEIPEGYSSSDLFYIEVDALPPEGCVIEQTREVTDAWGHKYTEDFEVEVVGPPTLGKRYGCEEYEYTIYVTLA